MISFGDMIFNVKYRPLHINLVKYFRRDNFMVWNRAGLACLDSRSRVPGVLGPRARGKAIFFKARGNAERKEVGTLISCAWSKNAIS